MRAFLLLLGLACTPCGESVGLPRDTQPDSREDSATDSPADSAADSPTETGDTAAPPEVWNVAFYVAADNNLSPFADSFLAELERVGSTPTMNVLVQIDRSEVYNPEGTWSDTRRYRIERDENEAVFGSPLLEELGEADMGDPATLTAFLEWVDGWPAERSLLVFWGHSAAWHGVGKDSDSRSTISIAQGELTAALDPRVQRAGPFDLIFFEGCYQAAWETGFAIQDQADWMAGSESRVETNGVDWELLLGWLAAQSTPVVTAELADVAAQAGALRGSNASFSAIDLAGQGALGRALDGLAGAVLDEHALAGPLRAACDPSPPTDPTSMLFLDLGACAEALLAGGEPGLAAPAATLAETVAAAVGSVYTSEELSWQTGVNVTSTQDQAEMTEYQAAIWADDTLWDDLIVLLGTL
jgi:hypothetical protein